MAYGNRGGGYGNRQGGRSSNGRGGGGYRGGNRGAGGRSSNRGGNRGGDDFKYVRSSFFGKRILTGEGDNQQAEEIGIEPGVTEEVTIVLSPQKTEQLLRKLDDAIKDPDGDGGIVLKAYCQHKVNGETDEEFDGASLLVLGKFPPRGGNGYGGNSSRGNGGRNGRRDYPDRQENSRGSSQASRDDGYDNSRGGPDDADASGYTENAGW